MIAQGGELIEKYQSNGPDHRISIGEAWTQTSPVGQSFSEPCPSSASSEPDGFMNSTPSRAQRMGLSTVERP